MSAKVSGWVTQGVAGLREFGPYAAIELVLPGGSLVAVAIWLYRRYRKMGTRT
jgi:hypothetical protein